MIVVTGAVGFIGSNLAHRLAGEGLELLLVDHELIAPKSINLAGLKRFTFQRHDEFLKQLQAGRVHPEAIFHLGACSATTEQNWDYLFENNVEYTRILWEWSTIHGKPFLYASSAATYGDGALGFDDHTHPSQLKPLNLYGKSKNDFDLWAYAQVEAKRPTPPVWAGVKFFNVYGPRETHKNRMASVVFQAHKQIRETGQMKLFRSTDARYPDGGQLRDFVFVEDCVDHLLWLWKQPHSGGVFNSGTGKARSFFDLVTAVFLALEMRPQISFIDMPTDLVKQYQNYTQAEMSKLRETGYPREPTSLEEGVRKYVHWLMRS
jgi:ADP-L-glycero-D-manno-heptose 6-epimerase